MGVKIVNKELIQVNTKLTANTIRRETYNGREHIVVPSYTLPFNIVMNREYYPEAEIIANYQSLEGTLAPLGHPTVDGEFVSAFSPEGLNIGFCGAWNRNVELRGNRVYVEKWVDVETASHSEQGRELLSRLEALEKGESKDPIWSSVAVYRQRMPATEEMKAQGADSVVKIMSIDHDAILLHEPPAASPEQGVGLMVNTDQAKPLMAVAMKENSYRTLERQLTEAARELLPDADYVYVVDFTDKEVTIATNKNYAEKYNYQKQADKIILNNGELATNEESKSWFAQFAEHLSNLFSLNEKIKANKSEDDPMPLTKEERAELVKEINEGLAANIANAVAEALKPVQASVEELQTNQKELQTNQKAIKEEIAANANKEVAEKRAAVAKVHGEIVANALSGEALEAMFKSLGKPAPMATNAASEGKKGEVPDFNTYF
ncbi:TPA: hypothetical protein P4F51_002512 [Escherichia coli]|nr:hypothetical protein [Escherichia coli]PQA27391.1 hypothetical protein C5F40_00410 [Escherichia coli]PQA30682.1 hypothetical protein C5F39_00410 [Escherichia coli]TZB92126.1 hypothetical protein E0K57_19215 [Escherichia coli]HAM8780357.1 hypothetical protein [Escherichia coli]HAM9104195.1 hypothetical protein [Escherichia coli]